MITLGWAVTTPVVIGMSRALNSSIYANPSARNAATAVEYVAYAWGPIFDILILLWAVISSARYDAESEVYG